MGEREKVIKGLELLKDFLGDGLPGKRYVFNSYIGIANDAIALLKEQGWISVEERFPEEPYGCLVTVWDSKPNGGDDFPNILHYFVGWDGEQWNDSDGVRCPFEVIAWMKLPEPYQPKD